MEEHTLPKNSPVPEPTQELVITFELIAKENEHDPALIATFGHEIVAQLQQQGYRAQPSVYTGQKGIESFFVELVTTIQQIATFIQSNQTVIAEGIADLSGIITIFGGIVPVLKCMQKVHEKQRGKEESASNPIKMTIEIDGTPLVIEVSDINQADAALKLALKCRSVHPTETTQVTTKSQVKVQGQVPARQPRRRK